MIQVLEDIIGDPRFSEGIAWKRHHVRANEAILREGEEGRSLYFIEDGRLRVTDGVELDEGRRVQSDIRDLGQGDIFGEVYLYQLCNRSATVTAMTDSRVLEIDRERLGVYLDEHPIQGYLFLKEVFNSLIDHPGRAEQRVENL